MAKRISVAGPSITQREIDYVTDAVTNCWYGDANRYHDRFEQAFAAYHGVKHAIALPSCTSAIHLSLAAEGIGPGDQVIVPDVTWIASAAPIDYVGAEVVFVDVEPDTWCMSVESFRAAITPRTKGVIVVDLYGNMPRIDAIVEIAKEHGLLVIEDAAEAFGSIYRGQPAGSFGDTGVFSFHGSKTMTTGEGGMLITNRSDLYERACILRDHGRVPGDVSFFNREVAFKYKMTSMQAALGLAQLERAEELIGRKREIFAWYRDDLGHSPWIQLNPELEGGRNSYWMSTAVVAAELGMEKREIQDLLARRGIDTRPFFYPLSSLPAYEHRPQAMLARARNEVSYKLADRGLNLPSALNVTREDARAVSGALLEIVASVIPAAVD